MKNFVYSGDILQCVAPAAGVLSGIPVLIGVMLLIPQADAAVGAQFAGQVRGVFDLTKKTSDDMTTVGAKLYWDDTAKNLTITATSNTFVGYVVEAAAATTASIVRAYLHGAPT